MDMICVGDNVVDCYLSEGVYYPGGNAINVAVRCKQNGCDNVAYIGIFGNDEKAEHQKDCLTKEGIDWHRSRTMFGITGSPGVRITPDGDRQFVPGPKETVQRIAALRLVDADLEMIHQYPVCHTSCFSNIEPELEKMHNATTISFDFSENRDEKYLKKVTPYLTYAFFSCSDIAEEEIHSLMATCHALGVKIVGCTLGSKGALFSDGINLYSQGIVPCKVVDTMGAGDAFIAGFLTKYPESKDMKNSLLYAAQRASFACQCHGGWGYPHALPNHV